MKQLIVATSNSGKLEEMQVYLSGLDWELALKPKELEIEENGSSFVENAIIKASGVAKALNQWAIADDSGLAVDALDGAPGIYSARFGNSDQDRIDRLLRELEGSKKRTAQFVCAIALCRPDGSLALQTEGICVGEILNTEKGEGGFGYDPIFYVPSTQKTFAEMSSELKNEVSHRGLAFAKLLPQLEELSRSEII